MDPLIVELRHSVLTPDVQDVSQAVFDALPAARTQFCC